MRYEVVSPRRAGSGRVSRTLTGRRRAPRNHDREHPAEPAPDPHDPTSTPVRARRGVEELGFNDISTGSATLACGREQSQLNIVRRHAATRRLGSCKARRSKAQNRGRQRLPERACNISSRSARRPPPIEADLRRLLRTILPHLTIPHCGPEFPSALSEKTSTLCGRHLRGHTEGYLKSCAFFDFRPPSQPLSDVSNTNLCTAFRFEETIQIGSIP
jgi:hypothetical protein